MPSPAITAKNIVSRPIFMPAGRKNTTSRPATQTAKPMNIRLAPVSRLPCSLLSSASAIETSSAKLRFKLALSLAANRRPRSDARYNLRSRPQNASLRKRRKVSQHPYFVAQLLDQLLRNLRRRAFDHFSLLGLLRNVETLDLLQIAAQRGLHLSHGHFAQRLVLGLLDADQRGVAQLVNAGLNGKHGGQRHVDELKESGLELAFHADAAFVLLDLHDDGRVRPAQQLGQDHAGLRVTVVVRLKTSEDQVELLVFDGGGEGAGS